MDLSKRNVKKLIGIVCTGILFYWGLEHFDLVLQGLSFLMDLLLPFTVGGIMAFIINVAMRPIEEQLLKLRRRNTGAAATEAASGAKDTVAQQRRQKHGAARGAALLLSLLAFVLVFVLVFSIVLPELYRTMQQLFRQIPVALQGLLAWLEELSVQIPGSILNEGIAYLEGLDWVTISKQAMNLAKNVLSGLAFSGIGVISSVVGSLTSFGIGFIFAMYLLLQKEQLAGEGKQLLYAYLSTDWADRMCYVLQLTNQTFTRFVRGQCLEAFILSCMFFVTMSLFRMPYTLLVSVVICVTALIPILGSFIGCAVGIFLIAIVNPMQALAFLVLFLVLQQIEGNLIYPHVVGSSIGLPGIWVLVAVTVGGGLMGIAGMLVFIPLCSVLYQLLKEQTKKRLANKGISAERF